MLLIHDRTIRVFTSAFEELQKSFEANIRRRRWARGAASAVILLAPNQRSGSSMVAAAAQHLPVPARGLSPPPLPHAPSVASWFQTRVVEL